MCIEHHLYCMLCIYKTRGVTEQDGIILVVAPFLRPYFPKF